MSIDSDHLSVVAAHSGRVELAALLILTMGALLALIPVVAFPVLRRHSELGSVGHLVFRGALESATYIAATICWLLLVPVAQEYVKIGAHADVENGMLVWRGVTPANYYTAASVAGIVAALGLITLPINLAGYRERGILRRFHASSVSASTLVSAELTLALVTFVAGTLVLAVVARLAYGAMLPEDVLGVAVALVIGTAAFGAIGLLLATVLRTSRSAQGIGLLLFFALWLISGTAPPRAVLPAGMRDVGGLLPLTHLVTDWEYRLPVVLRSVRLRSGRRYCDSAAGSADARPCQALTRSMRWVGRVSVS